MFPAHINHPFCEFGNIWNHFPMNLSIWDLYQRYACTKLFGAHCWEWRYLLFPESWKESSEVNCGSFTIHGPSVELHKVLNIYQDPKHRDFGYNIIAM